MDSVITWSEATPGPSPGAAAQSPSQCVLRWRLLCHANKNPVRLRRHFHRHGRACPGHQSWHSAATDGRDKPHRHQDKPGRGENICRFRRRLGSARSLCARGSASRMARGVRPDRPPTTASITSLETRQREQRPWEARSSGGRFQEILANVFGQQNQDQMGIQPTQAACVGAGG
jgi:hypothetical protein